MSKTVKFRRDSPSGGSYLDHQRSDSGVGSFSSDNESRAAYPDRAFAGSDYDNSTLYALLATETNEKKEWMDKAQKLDNLLIRAHKELKETQARLRGLEDHVEELEDEKSKLSKEKQSLSDENSRLKDSLKEFKDSKRSSHRKSGSPPSMSGANPITTAADDDKRPRRSASKRHSIGRREQDTERIEIEKERERISREMEKEREKERDKEKAREKDKEMDRLRKRFDNRAAGEESDANSSKTSSKSKHSRRGSYVEPLGPPGVRPQATQAPPPPSARHGQYPPYSNSGYAPQPTYAPNTVPRVVHPQVVVSYSDAFQDEEDGLYHPHPLPSRGQRSPDRRERR